METSNRSARRLRRAAMRGEPRARRHASATGAGVGIGRRRRRRRLRRRRRDAERGQRSGVLAEHDRLARAPRGGRRDRRVRLQREHVRRRGRRRGDPRLRRVRWLRPGHRPRFAVRRLAAGDRPRLPRRRVRLGHGRRHVRARQRVRLHGVVRPGRLRDGRDGGDARRRRLDRRRSGRSRSATPSCTSTGSSPARRRPIADLEVGVNYTESFSDTALAAEAATSFIDGGATVLIGHGADDGRRDRRRQRARRAVVRHADATRPSSHPRSSWPTRCTTGRSSSPTSSRGSRAATLGGETYDINLANGGVVIEFNADYDLPADVDAAGEETHRRS